MARNIPDWKCNILKTFTFLGKPYEYSSHEYNETYRNERTIEVPIIWEYVKEYKGKNILEIGNVLSHYFPVDHDIVDKDEVADRVINQDIVDYKPDKKYDLIVSISTMEHIGHFENPGSWVQPQKVLVALQNLKNLLAPNGKIIITFGMGYNYLLDAHIKLGNIKFDKMACMRRISKDNEWEETEFDKIKNDVYGQPFNGSNNVIIGFINK